MWWIIGIIFILITICVLKDTHIKVYYNYYYKKECAYEYDYKLPIWALLLIVLIYLIPIVNIVVFVSFSICYIIHTVGDLVDYGDKIYVFSLNGNNWVTKGLLAIKGVLNKKL